MKKQTYIVVLFLALLTTLSGCAVVGGIFKTGMVFGILIAAIVIAIIVFFVVRMGKNK